ncbi:MAG TPA: 16S rRNA (adenine(1518)-N(6)/adenine(1519)-N(6))-dimethyltransferase RsmA [Alphaproteobacteria bacterium]|nr:16S rRNA (adenine(1518)-N(6)/adenine(1519)-N(6))-dimethyltransferase RsmA [Alphaproteobacteria bacterium]
MSDRAGLPPLRQIVRQHGLVARRSLGQHFLLDLNLTRKIARAADAIDQGTVIEIGPGPGGLTRALLIEGARKVIGIETDPRCLGALAEIAAAYPGRLEVIQGDALEIDVFGLGDPPRQIVANLPYNISTALLVRWLGSIGAFARLTLMFQKEVADRLLARPGSKDYGRLTVLTQWLTVVKPLFNVPAAAFSPPPKVDSTVVQITPRPAPLYPADRASLEKITAAAFGQRRKMLRQSLRQVTPDPRALLSAAGIQETARAEQIDIGGFCALARALKLPRHRSGAAG